MPGIPLTNYAGWLLVGVADDGSSSTGAPATPAPAGRRAVPAALLVWTWLGYVLGNVFWFGTGPVALVGGVLLGLLVVPYAWSLWQSRP